MNELIKLVANVALTSGQKTAATIGAKVATSVAAASASYGVNCAIDKLATQEPEEVVSKGKQLGKECRKAAVAGTFSAIGIIGFKALNEVIENSNII